MSALLYHAAEDRFPAPGSYLRGIASTGIAALVVSCPRCEAPISRKASGCGLRFRLERGRMQLVGAS